MSSRRIAFFAGFVALSAVATPALAQGAVAEKWRWLTFLVFGVIIAMTMFVTYLAAKRVKKIAQLSDELIARVLMETTSFNTGNSTSWTAKFSPSHRSLACEPSASRITSAIFLPSTSILRFTSVVLSSCFPSAVSLSLVRPPMAFVYAGMKM